MAVNFPNNPNIGDVHVVGFITKRWNGYAGRKFPNPQKKFKLQDTKVECIDTGTNGFVQIDTNGSERIRIGRWSDWMPGTNYGTQGQVLTSQGLLHNQHGKIKQVVVEEDPLIKFLRVILMLKLSILELMEE